MQGWIVGIICTVAELVITTVVGFLLKRWWDKREEEKKELERLREEQRARVEQARCETVKQSLHNELKPIKQDMLLMKRAMQKDIRRSLRQDAQLYRNRGYASHQEKTEFDELYWVYHNLGKNGVVDRDHEDVMNLPEQRQGE